MKAAMPYNSVSDCTMMQFAPGMEIESTVGRCIC